MITKNDIVLNAFSEMRISGITVSPNPTEVTDAITVLDNMMLNWENENICIGYIRPESYGQSDPNDDSGIPDTAVFAVVANLSKVLCPSYGKQPHMQTLANARQGKSNLYNIELPQRENNPFLPKGSGEVYGYYGYSYRTPKFQSQTDDAPDNCQTSIIKVGQIDSYTYDFNSLIADGDSIDSYTVDYGSGVSVLEHAESDGFITLKCEGLSVGFSKVKITLNFAPSGLINPVTINFDVRED